MSNTVACGAPRRLPDVADSTIAPVPGTLDLVGMSHVEVPVCLSSPGSGRVSVLAYADAYVDLVDPQARGIHMSRLYFALSKHLPTKELSIPLLRRLLSDFLETHSDVSRTASLRLSFQLLDEVASLKSSNVGWRAYPVDVEAFHDRDSNTFRVWLTVQVTYSSTCPCSGALARQLIRDRFGEDFAGRAQVPMNEVADWLSRPESICATPHSQRSHASVTVELDASVAELCPLRLVRLVEDALKTPVQAAVKREDEQEFALRNGQNMMFCEDAGRRMRRSLDAMEGVVDFKAEARHQESLHPHDAVSVIVKGVPGGLQPTGAVLSRL